MNIDDFIAKTKPRSKKSIFDEHYEDISRLINLHYSQKQVIEFLKTKCKNKTGLSEQNLSCYLKKHKGQKAHETKQAQPLNNSNHDNTSMQQDLLDLVSSLRK